MEKTYLESLDNQQLHKEWQDWNIRLFNLEQTRKSSAVIKHALNRMGADYCTAVDDLEIALSDMITDIKCIMTEILKEDIRREMQRRNSKGKEE